MAEAMEGIMGLPQAPNEAVGPMPMDPAVGDPLIQSYARSNPKQFRGEMMTGLEEADPQIVAQFRQGLSQIQMPPELLAALQMIVDAVLENPEGYPAIREMLLKEDVPEELLPEVFDPAYFMAFAAALDQIEAQVGSMPAPQNFADGGIAELKPIAKAMQDMGRGGDTLLAHINPQEARLLKQLGGSGTINPMTGLPEFGWFSKVFKSVKKVVKSVVKTVKNVVSAIAENPIGRIALTIGATMLLGPGSFGLIEGGLAGGILGVSTPALAFGINTAAASTLVNVASGQSFGDALKGGLVAGVMAGGTAYMFPSTLPEAYNTQAATAANAAASGIPVEDLTTKAGDLAATPGTGFTGPTSVADVSVGIPKTEVYTPGDVGVSAAAPTPVPPTGAVTSPYTPPYSLQGAQYETYFPPVEQSIGSVGGGQGYADLRAFSSTGPSYQPSVMRNLSDSVTSSAPSGLAQPDWTGAGRGLAAGDVLPTSANAYGGTTPFFDELGSMEMVYPPSAPPAGGPPATGSGFLDSLQQGDLGGAYEAAKQNTMDVWNNYLSPNRPSMMPSGDAAKEYTRLTGQPFVEGVTPTADKVGWEAAVKAASTGGGTMARYAPLAGVGLGAAYLGGAFEPIPEEPPLNVADMYNYELEPFQYGGTSTSYQLNPMAGEGGTQFQGTGYQGQYQFNRGQYNPYDYTVGNLGIEGLTPLGLSIKDMPSYKARNYAEGGTAEYPRKNGHISGPGGPKDDKIPAMLSDGEFVFTAKAVRNMGNGSRRSGAKKMYALMKALEGRAS
jgi:hypothetical protein